MTVNQPLVTQAQLIEDLHRLGVRTGMTLLVHSSMRKIGWIPGGAVAVIQALETVLGEAGTLVMPTHSSDLTDPAHWVNPPVPATWWPEIYAHTPPFQPDITPTFRMGIIPETFRKQKGVVRSEHPHESFAAWGARKAEITASHALTDGMGEQSPLGRIYAADGYVLLIGVGHDRNTSLHLAEARARWPGRRMEQQGAPMLVNGRREWIRFQTLAWNDDDFPQIAAAYIQAGGHITQGHIGAAQSQLMAQRPLVDFAVSWMEANRGRATASGAA